MYTMGCVAQRTEQGDFKQLQETLKIAELYIQESSIYGKKNSEILMINSVSCLGKIIYYHGSYNLGIVLPSIVKNFILRLPLDINIQDEQGIKLIQSIHSQLLQHVENSVFAVHV